MRFLNREDELERLDTLVERGGGFAAVYGAKVIVKSVPAAIKALAARPLPSSLPGDVEIVRALFVASARPGPGVITAADLLMPRG